MFKISLPKAMTNSEPALPAGRQHVTGEKQ